jgi:ABC-2 type transport system ATP-binding protein
MRIIVKRMLVDAMCERKLTVVISSHNLKEINEMCDSAALLHKGKIIFNRQLDSLKGAVHKVQAVFSDKEHVYTAADFPSLEILHFDKTQSIYHIIAKGDEETIRAGLAPQNPVVADMVPLTLEEIFITETAVSGYDFKDLFV